MSKRQPPEFEKAKQEFYEEKKGKVFCLGENLIPTVKCYGVISIHHAKGRKGSLLTDKRYFKPLCRAHHDWVHRNRKEAIECGLTYPQTFIS